MNSHKKGLAIISLVVLSILAMLPLNVVEAQDEALFSVTIIAPGNANMLRRQWGQIIANSLIQIGIDARVVYLGWASVYDRVFTPPVENVGKTYDDGGFDIQLVGYTPGLIPDLAQLYYGSPESFAPTGNNYYLYNNTEANSLMDIYLTTTNTIERDQVAQRLQTILHSDLPASIIFYAITPTAITPELGGPALGPSPGGEGWLYFNEQPNPEMLTGKTEVVYCSTGEIDCLIPPLSFSWYDTIIIACIHNGLVEVAPDLSDLSIPALLTDWTASENGFKWTWTCRSGVKWHDGADFTADDVVFSLWALMNADTGSQFVGTYQRVYGDNVKFTYANGSSTTLGTGTRVGNITALNATTIEIWLPELLPGKPYGFFDPYLLGLANNIIPKHIFEKIAPEWWTDSPFNTGEGTIVVPGTPGTVAPETYDGPVGTGPYKWVDYDPVAQLVHLEKFTDYWNATALEADGLFGVTDYYIRFIADKTPALAALKNDEVQMLDPNYMMQVDIPTIDPTWGKVLVHEGTGLQEVGFNNRHPVFGTGVDTPLGTSDPTRAAEAANYVKIAIDYAIPRQLIIDNLLAGYGKPGAVHWLPTNPYYNASVTARPYDLVMAKNYLEKAGYAVPPPPAPPEYELFIGMSTAISGVYLDPATGNVAANRELKLMVTTDNATFDTTSTMVGRTTTDLSGWYTFTVTPPSTGVFYYYLFDHLAVPIEEFAQWKYLTMINVSSLDDVLSLLYQRLDAINATLVSIEGKTATIETDIGVIRTDVDTVNAKLAVLNDTVATIQTDIGTITTDIANIQLKVTTINGTIATIQTTLGTFEGQITSIEGNISAIVTELGTIKTTLEEWTGGTTGTITTPAGSFQILVLTTSTLESPIAFSDNILALNLSGPSGTTGTTNAVIPKQLLVGTESSIDKVVVTIDDKQVVFTYTENPEAYVLHVTYAHSTHLMKVHLTGLPPTPFPAWIIAIIVLIVALAIGVAFYILRVRKPRLSSHTKRTDIHTKT
jgi:peptide/nickel transport system substrate-binding protein